MAKRALVLRHMSEDNPGRFAELMRDDGIEAVTVDLHRGAPVPALADYDLMLVLGGAQQVWEEDQYPWLVAEKQAIRDWVRDRAKPFVGICLGHQLLATALGGEAGYAAEPEIGVLPVELHGAGRHRLADGLAPGYAVTQWHVAEVTRVPDEATVLASSALSPVQMMAVDRHAVSVQFHFEWTLDGIRGWQPSWVDMLHERTGPGGYDRLVADAAVHMPAMDGLARQVWANLKRSSGLTP